MKRTTLSLLVVGIFAGVGNLVTAPNVAARTQSNATAESTTQKKPTRQTQLSTAAIDQSKEADYKAAKAKAQMEYKNATAKCRKRSSKAIPACMTDAKAVRTEALAQAKARWGNQQYSP
jgi:23S rRNA pseudoU1915 N3-methylase RlmH